jgi:hypothetical protein
MYAEELDPRSRGHVGNYPLRLMHVALINAVMHVVRAERTLAERPGHERLVSAAGSSVRLVIRSGPWAAG